MTLSDPKVSSFHSPTTHDLRTMNNPLVAQCIKIFKNVSSESYCKTSEASCVNDQNFIETANIESSFVIRGYVYNQLSRL